MKKRGILLIVTTFIFSFLLTGCHVEITATYDAVILGSGASSLTTALTLSEQGKRVIIIEETGIVGGNKRMISDGISFLNTTEGDSVEQFMTDIETNNGSTNFFTQTMIEKSAQIPSWLEKYNIQLDETIKLPGSSVARTLVSSKGVHTGKEVITKLETAIKNSNVEVSYNSKITKIVSEKKDMYQLTIEQPNSIINVNARTFVLAEDQQTIFDTKVPITNMTQLDDNNFSSITSMTTGMELLQTLGADYNLESELNIIDTYNLTSAQQISPILRSSGAMLINASGKRFVNEMEDSPHVIEAILNQEEQVAYLLYDSVIDDKLSFLNEYYKSNTLLKVDSVTVLANSLNFDEETLRSTIANYRQMIETGEDIEFGRSFDVDEKVFSQLGTDQGSLFIIKITPVTTPFPAYAEITDKFEVMKNGVALKGVYATGDSASDVRLSDQLHGTDLTTAIIMGDSTAEYILEYLASLG